MSKRKKIILIVLAACVLLGGAMCAWVALSNNIYAVTARQYVKNAAAVVTIHFRNDEKENLPDDAVAVNYVDGAETEKISIRSWKDSKRVYRGTGITRLVNYSTGYQLDLPENTEFDFSLSPVYVTAENELFSATISRERSPYTELDDTMAADLAVLQPGRTYRDGVDQYIAFYQNRFLLSPDWQQANGVTVTESELTAPCGSVQYLTAVVNEPGEMEYDARSYLYIRGEGNIYYRIIFRYDSDDAAAVDEAVKKAAESFYGFTPYGTEIYTAEYSLEGTDGWNEETAEFYETLCSSDVARWGLFVEDVFETGVEETIPELEKKFEHTFSVVLGYQHMDMEPLTDFLNTNWQNGKITEYTYQITTSNNLDLYGRSPLMDTAKGEKDEEIRTLARALKEFGHPVLFRLNNEMNSDWVSYGGIINLEDPEIYKEAWKRMYRVFEEEGVDNVIWVYNPNDNNYPPSNWNNFLAYYPGDGYTQMIGVTGYNTGTYYKEVWSEDWREFKDIYDAVEYKYTPFFGEFPWMITEFASSSIGGDKAQWITDMFAVMGDYENIKIAVWFSYADFDPREGFEGQVSRPYWIDETEEVVDAFREGLKDVPSGW